MKKGQVAEGRIDRVVFPNKGIAITEEGERVVVKNTIPGQKVSFLVNKVRKGKAEARLLETLEKSPLEVEPSCPHFGECGGCTYLSLPMVTFPKFPTVWLLPFLFLLYLLRKKPSDLESYFLLLHGLLLL